jgi:hypothetical protein
VGFSEYCFFGCKNQRLVFKSHSGEKAYIYLPKKVEIWKLTRGLYIFTSFDSVDFTMPNIDSSLTLTATAEVGEPKVSIEFQEHKESCERICINEVTSCDNWDVFGRCTDPMGERSFCREYTTRCTPAYEVCMEHTLTPMKMILSITKTDTKEEVAKYITKEKIRKRSNKISMSKCFEK